MDELPAHILIMSIIVFSCQHCNDQRVQTLSLCTLYDFLSNKVRNIDMSTVTDLILSLFVGKKYKCDSHICCYIYMYVGIITPIVSYKSAGHTVHILPPPPQTIEGGFIFLH